MLRKTLAVIVLLCLVASSPAAYGQTDVRREAQNMINTLNPVNQALGPLIDNAIASANNDMRDRLEQLRGIIGEALTNLNAIIKDSTIRLNADGEARLNQLNGHVRDNLDLFNKITSGTITHIDKAAADRIDQFETSTVQLIEILPIPAQPLPKAPKDGFALVKPMSKEYALLYISGAGLTKGGTKPHAYLLNGDKSDTNYLSHNGTELQVMAASMGLIQVKIPTALFPAKGQSDKSIVLKLAKDNLWPGSVEASFPLLLCSKLPEYSASIQLLSKGQVWSTRQVPYPNYTDANQKEYYIDDHGSNFHVDLCAKDANSEGWEPDVRINGPKQFFGLQYANQSEHVGEIIPNYPEKGCVRLYAGRDRSGGGHAEVFGLVVNQRKLTTGDCGSKAIPSSPLKYGANTIDTSPDDATKTCLEAKDGATSSATVRTRLTVSDDSGSSPDVQDMPTSNSVGELFVNGAVNVSMNQFGLMRLNVTATCRQQETDYLAR